MGTRSRIGIEKKDGTIESIYCHWDGYLEHNGKLLVEHYSNSTKLKKLLKLGSISILAPELGKKHDFNNPTKGWVLAYKRDRGETEVDSETHKNRDVYYNSVADEEYVYLFTQRGDWRVYNGSGWRLVIDELKAISTEELTN